VTVTAALVPAARPLIVTKSDPVAGPGGVMPSLQATASNHAANTVRRPHRSDADIDGSAG
jgi:hypothetical protein